MEMKVPCADEGVVNGEGQTKTSGQETVERMSLLSDAGENKAMEAMPKTIERTLS